MAEITGLLAYSGVNLTSMKGGLLNFPLFLLEGNAILPMTPKAGCDCAAIENNDHQQGTYEIWHVLVNRKVHHGFCSSSIISAPPAGGPKYRLARTSRA